MAPQRTSLKPAHILLFDIDATLLLTGGAGQVAIENTFRDVLGLEKVWRDIVPDGKTDPAIFDEIAWKVLGRALTQQEHSRLCRRYFRHFPEALRQSKRFRLMPGVKKLLASLSRRDDVYLGLATGNFEKTAWMKLAHGGIDHHFTFGGFACDSRDRSRLTRLAVLRGKRKIRLHQTLGNILIIGDSCHDVRAGKAAGARTVAVLTGATSRRRILAEKPDYLFDDLNKLNDFLKLLK